MERFADFDVQANNTAAYPPLTAEEKAYAFGGGKLPKPLSTTRTKDERIAERQRVQSSTSYIHGYSSQPPTQAHSSAYHAYGAAPTPMVPQSAADTTDNLSPASPFGPYIPRTDRRYEPSGFTQSSQGHNGIVVENEHEYPTESNILWDEVNKESFVPETKFSRDGSDYNDNRSRVLSDDDDSLRIISGANNGAGPSGASDAEVGIENSVQSQSAVISPPPSENPARQAKSYRSQRQRSSERNLRSAPRVRKPKKVEALADGRAPLVPRTGLQDSEKTVKKSSKNKRMFDAVEPLEPARQSHRPQKRPRDSDSPRDYDGTGQGFSNKKRAYTGAELAGQAHQSHRPYKQLRDSDFPRPVISGDNAPRTGSKPDQQVVGQAFTSKRDGSDLRQLQNGAVDAESPSSRVQSTPGAEKEHSEISVINAGPAVEIITPEMYNQICEAGGAGILLFDTEYVNFEDLRVQRSLRTLVSPARDITQSG